MSSRSECTSVLRASSNKPLCALVKILWSTIVQPTKFEVSNTRKSDGEEEDDGNGSKSEMLALILQTSFLRALLSSYAEAFFFEDKTPVMTIFFFYIRVEAGPNS